MLLSVPVSDGISLTHDPVDSIPGGGAEEAKCQEQSQGKRQRTCSASRSCIGRAPAVIAAAGSPVLFDGRRRAGADVGSGCSIITSRRLWNSGISAAPKVPIWDRSGVLYAGQVG